MKKPNSLELSSDRMARLTRGMACYVERGQEAGLVSLVSRYGEITALESFGRADIEAGRQMQHEPLFRVYSMTKPITSVAVLTLLEEGGIDSTRLLGRKTVELMLADRLIAGSVLWGNPAMGLGLGVAVQRRSTEQRH
jgi:hypothetical protein